MRLLVHHLATTSLDYSTIRTQDCYSTRSIYDQITLLLHYWITDSLLYNQHGSSIRLEGVLTNTLSLGLYDYVALWICYAITLLRALVLQCSIYRLLDCSITGSLDYVTTPLLHLNYSILHTAPVLLGCFTTLLLDSSTPPLLCCSVALLRYCSITMLLSNCLTLLDKHFARLLSLSPLSLNILLYGSTAPLRDCVVTLILEIPVTRFIDYSISTNCAIHLLLGVLITRELACSMTLFVYDSVLLAYEYYFTRCVKYSINRFRSYCVAP